jgi:hypothetical protein
MAKKRNARNAQKLKADVERLRADLKQSEAKRAKWKKRATRAETAVTDLRTRLGQAENRAGNAPSISQENAPAESQAHTAKLSGAADRRSSGREASTRPDASWTVAQLREEARRRGLTGLSGKPKAELITALT